MSDRVIITVRLVRSFEHRNVRPLVLKNVDLSMSVTQFKTLVDGEIQASNLPSVFKAPAYFDSFKLETWVNGAKSGNAVINVDSPLMNGNKTLAESGVEVESELSYFNLFDYQQFCEYYNNGIK